MAITHSIQLRAAVGKGASNRSSDVKLVQQRLNDLMGPSRQKLVVDGLSGPKTHGMIRDFQSNVLGFRWPDERVDPGGKTLRALNDSASAQQWRRVSQPIPIHVQAPGHVPVIAQPSSRSCWATVATMMISWRRGRSMPIRDAIETVGQPWLDHFDNNRVLLWTQTEAFGRAAGMRSLPLQSYSVEGFAELLRSARSPLFVSIHPSGNPQNLTHIVVVVGMSGDKTPDGTRVTYNDPAGGVRRTSSFREFHQRYEGSARSDLTVQILHY